MCEPANRCARFRIAWHVGEHRLRAWGGPVNALPRRYGRLRHTERTSLTIMRTCGITRTALRGRRSKLTLAVQELPAACVSVIVATQKWPVFRVAVLARAVHRLINFSAHQNETRVCTRRVEHPSSASLIWYASCSFSVERRRAPALANRVWLMKVESGASAACRR